MMATTATTKRKVTCPKCGSELSGGLGQHLDNGPCRVGATRRRMAERGWVVYDTRRAAALPCALVDANLPQLVEWAPEAWIAARRAHVREGWWTPQWVKLTHKALGNPQAKRSVPIIRAVLGHQKATPDALIAAWNLGGLPGLKVALSQVVNVGPLFPEGT